MDHGELMREFGLSEEQAIELHFRVGRAIWAGFQAGAIVTITVLLIASGIISIFRALHH